MSRKKVVKAIFDNVNKLSTELVAQSSILKDLLKVHVPFSIEEALKTNKQYARVFEINNSGYFVDIHKKNWIQALEKCISFYIETDDYEQCAKLKSLISEVQSKRTSVKVKKD